MGETWHNIALTNRRWDRKELGYLITVDKLSPAALTCLSLEIGKHTPPKVPPKRPIRAVTEEQHRNHPFSCRRYERNVPGLPQRIGITVPCPPPHPEPSSTRHSNAAVRKALVPVSGTNYVTPA